MSAETVNKAVATRNGVEVVVETNRGILTELLPSHVKHETWMAVVFGSLRKNPELRDAATKNPGSLMNALATSARLGLDPGTEQYYLTPRKTKTGPEVLGIVGYQGIVELIYRAGAVSSVVVEVVRERDSFRYVPGRDDRPVHEINWDADDRGKLRLVYAYAVMKDGATSKVVVLNRRDIEHIKTYSKGADSQYSPWRTNEPAMWLKSAARQLGKWVPTSSEYIREQLRAARDVAAEPPRPLAQGGGPAPVADMTGAREVPTTVDAELVDEPTEAEWAADAQGDS
jgi:recombination protein RecT